MNKDTFGDILLRFLRWFLFSGWYLFGGRGYKIRPRIIFLAVALLPLASNTLLAKEKKSLRVGFFPNVTHAQPIVGLARGDFQKALGENIKIETKLFNAGPSVIEAIFAGEIDMSYIGPSPTINGYTRSDGKALRLVAGACSGGAVFVSRPDVEINSPQDLEGKTIASPQLGNTQDISLRKYIQKAGLKPMEKGGKVKITPVANPDILNLFLQKQLDGAWVPEPWGARLVYEANGKVFLDERDLWPKRRFATTIIIATPKLIEEHPELLERWLRAHVEVTQWINTHPEEAKGVINSELRRLTTRGLPSKVLDAAFQRVEFTYDPIVDSVETFANDAYELGFVKKRPDLSNLYSLDLLNKVLVEKGLGPVTGKGTIVGLEPSDP